MGNDTTSFTRRRLPHWSVAGKSYFVTFRLRGTLPKDVVVELCEKREEIRRTENTTAKEQFERNEFAIIEKILDSVSTGAKAILTNDGIPDILMERFAFLENKYCWRFSAYVIMPNHIHCLCIADKTGENISLSKVFGEYKKYTARRINNLLGVSGRLWVDENFDHWCRNPDQEARVKKYIANNPVKAGLVVKVEDWKWGRY